MLLLALACQPAPRALARPNRLAIDADGFIYVSDFHHDRIAVFNPSGEFYHTFGTRGISQGELWRVTAMTFTRDGALIIANRRPETDDESSKNRFEIKRFEDGAERSSIQLDGRTLQPDGWVDAIVQGRDDSYIIADSAHGEILEIDENGRLVGRFGGIPRPDAAPSGLVADGEDLWVVEQHRHRISRVSPGGEEHLLSLGDPLTTGPRFPSAIALCRQERWLAIADLGNHRMLRYTLDGKLLAEWDFAPLSTEQPVQLLDIAINGDCSRLWAVDSKGNRVLGTTANGVLVSELSQW